jgi:HD-like signal output (HDOD) protein
MPPDINVRSNTPPTLENVCEQALRLPCAPSLLPRLITALQDNISGADDIEAIIRLDPALAASTLRVANSAFFSSGEPIVSLAEAVMRLGMKEIFRLSALALINRWESGSGRGAYRGDPGDFCRHALCTALAAEALAEATERTDPQSAYTAGLVCDLGKLAVAHACGPFFPSIRLEQARLGGAWTRAEREVLGYDHTQVGARLLETWRFPPVLITAAQFCQQPLSAPAESLALLAHLHAAKYLAISFGPGVAEDGFYFELNEPFLLEWGFTPEFLQEMLPVVLERASARLRDKLTFGAMAL